MKASEARESIKREVVSISVIIVIMMQADLYPNEVTSFFDKPNENFSILSHA